jgi:hypothetical protein
MDIEQLKDKLKNRGNPLKKVDLNYIKIIYLFWEDDTFSKEKIIKELKSHDRRIKKVNEFIKNYIIKNKVKKVDDNILNKIVEAYNGQVR